MTPTPVLRGIKFTAVMNASSEKILQIFLTEKPLVIFCPTLAVDQLCRNNRWDCIVYTYVDNELHGRYINTLHPNVISTGPSQVGVTYDTTPIIPNCFGSEPLSADASNCGLVVGYYVAGYICSRLGNLAVVPIIY